jgi:hypothetical protein
MCHNGFLLLRPARGRRDANANQRRVTERRFISAYRPARTTIGRLQRDTPRFAASNESRASADGMTFAKCPLMRLETIDDVPKR